MASVWDGITDEAGEPYVLTSLRPGMRIGRTHVGVGHVGAGTQTPGKHSVLTSVPVESTAGDTIGKARLATYYRDLDGFEYPNIPAGKGRLALYFADFNASGDGQNVLDVGVNGITVATGMDPYALAGGNHEHILKVDNVDIPGGPFRVTITATSGRSFLNDATMLTYVPIPVTPPPLPPGTLKFGWYGGNDASVVTAAQSASGVSLQVLSCYVDSRFSLSGTFEGGSGATAWLLGDVAHRLILLNVNIMIADPGNYSNPNINSEMAAIATYLVAQGIAGQVILRVGYEANGDFGFPWQPRSHGNNFAGFKAMWRSAHATVQAIHSFLWDYCCVPWDANTAEMEAMYPGDDVVNICGLDHYDRDTFAGSIAANVAQHQARLQVGINFAASHSKPWSIDESGLWQTDMSGGGGDNPAWIRMVMSMCANQHALWWVYFDADPDEPSFILENQPNGLAAFREVWALAA